MFVAYILYSTSKDKYYVGHTNDLERRLYEHNLNRTLGANDWQVKFAKPFQTRAEAMAMERTIKSKKRRAFIEHLISSAG